MILCLTVLLTVVLAVPALAAEGQHAHCLCGGTLNIAACCGGSIVAAEGNAACLLYTDYGFINLYGGTVDASGCKAGNGDDGEEAS